MDKLLLEGRNAIITGGSKGIGKAAADLFVAEGANVIITARGKEALDATVAEIQAKNYPGNIMGMIADSSSEEDAAAVYAAMKETFGPLDVMVNNAGVASRNSLECTSDEEWNKIMAINVNGPMYYIRQCLPDMLERKSGSIITVSSVAGTRYISGAAYTTSKAAVIGLTKNIAFRGIDDHVRANVVCPGHVDTCLAQTVAALLGDSNSGTPMSKFTDRFLNRGEAYNASPEQLAYAILYFACDMSVHVTGQVLTVDPGTFL